MIESQFKGTRYFSVLIYLLRDRSLFLEEIQQGIRLHNKIMSLLVCSVMFFGVYGAIIGSSYSWQQALSSAFKLPVFYLVTLAICFPTLYFFNVLFGCRKSATQHLAVLMASIAVISVLLFSFAPITLFFILSTKNYQFFKLLNVAIFAITGLIGVKLLYQGMQLISQEDSEGAETRQKILQSWLILYGFVSCQLGWTISPFFGDPTKPFMLFNQTGGNFYLDIIKAIAATLGFT